VKDDKIITIDPTFAMVEVYSKIKRVKQIKINYNRKLELDYKNYKHRYYPKLSKDKKKWTKIDEIFISKKEDGKIVIIDFLPSNQKEYVASQELITDFWYDEWYNELESSGRVKREIIGFSVLRNPIHMFFAEKNTNNPYILILGRQHPPEVTGALAMKSFINELLTENFLTDSFLDRYNILFVPLMNPDGVMNGFWRYNANKKDLNRDWGNFTQPETDAVYKKLIKLSNKKLVLFIDFHSTFKNIFYISDVLEDSSMKHFLRDWLGDSRDSLSEINYSYEIINSLNKDNGVSKNYIYNKYKIPSVTYEVSDNENRNIIQQSSSVLATNLMKLLLKIE